MVLSMKVLRKRANQKVFTKVSTQTKLNMKLMEKRMRNLQLQIIQSSTRQAILTDLSVVKTS